MTTVCILCNSIDYVQCVVSCSETKDPRQPPVLPTDLSIHLLQKIQELEEVVNHTHYMPL